MALLGGLKAGLIQGRGVEGVVRLVDVFEPWRGGFHGPFGYLGSDSGLRNGFQDRQAWLDRS